MVLLAAGLAAAASPAPAPAAVEPVRLIGTIPMKGDAVADPEGRLWYESFNSGAGVAIEVRDLDSLEVLGTIQIDQGPLRTNIKPKVVDSRRARLFTVRYDELVRPFIVVIDGRSRQVIKEFPLTANPTPLAVVMGLAYDDRTDDLYVAWQVGASSDIAIGSAHLEVSLLNGTTGEIRSSRVLDECTGFNSASVSAGTIENAYLRPGVSGSTAYLSCRIGRIGRNEAEPGVNQLLRIDFADPSAPTIERWFLTGVQLAGTSFFPKSDRQIIGNSAGVQAGGVVFQGGPDVFVGAVPGTLSGYGVDVERGRLYACNLNGLLISDAGAATPIPPGATYKAGAGCDYAGKQIVVDPVRRNVFVSRNHPNQWLIVRDDLPAYVPEPPSDPDAGTIDVPERPGVTDSTFGARAAGYGARVVLVGGPRGAAENLAGGPLAIQLLNGVGTSLYHNTHEAHQATNGATPEITQDPPNLGYATHVYWLGRVAEAGIDKDAAFATASGADRSKSADADMNALDNPGVLGGQPLADPEDERPGLEWPEEHEPRSCLALGGTTDRPEAEGAGVRLSCSMGQSVRADAMSPHMVVGSPAVVTVGEAGSTATITRDPVRGAVSTVRSWARNVVLGGIASIDEVHVTAESWARGRRGSAGSRYERSFVGVRIDGPRPFQCTSADECDPKVVAARLNEALKNRIRVRLPEPEATLRGSPGGATAVVARDRWGHLEQQTIYGLPGDDTTFPALELEVVADQLSRARVLYSLAGVALESSYRIFELPRAGADGPGDDEGTGTVAGELAPGASGLGAVTTTLTAATTMASSNGPQSLLETVLEKIKAGMRWLFGWHDATVLVLLTWALFGTPVYLGARRRLLGRTLTSRPA